MQTLYFYAPTRSGIQGGCGQNSLCPQEGYSEAENQDRGRARETKLIAKTAAAEQTLKTYCDVKPPCFVLP